MFCARLVKLEKKQGDWGRVACGIEPRVAISPGHTRGTAAQQIKLVESSILSEIQSKDNF